jgi:hypothetical protein
MRDNQEYVEAAKVLAKGKSLRKLTDEEMLSVMTPITNEERIKMDIKALSSCLSRVETMIFDSNWQYTELEEELIRFRRVMDVVLKRHNIQ